MKEGKEIKSETTIVVFGGTGDLMQKKIAPALFTLENIKIIGCGRSQYSNESYFSFLNAPENFKEKLFYSQGDLSDESFYKNLNLKLQELNSKQIIIYCSIMPRLYPIVIPKLKQEFVSVGNLKLIIEKPFGLDEKSATELNSILTENFKDEQIFRVEHYLAKDIIQYIPKFRFQTGEYEKYFNKEFVESIDVSLLETLDVDKRGDFYDGVGTLRDVGQNHILQMLALVCCENLENLSIAKSNFFESNLDFVSAPEFKIFQYNGYKNIKGVKENSETETAFVINTELIGERWKDVKIKLEAGKAFKEDKKQIKISFKNCELKSIIFDIVQNKIFVNLGGESKVVDVGEKQIVQYVGEYAKLFSAAIVGSQKVFVSFVEIRFMWKFIDKYINFIKNNNLKPEIYERNS